MIEDFQLSSENGLSDTIIFLLVMMIYILAINFLLKVTILVKYKPFEEKGFYASQLNTCIGSYQIWKLEVEDSFIPHFLGGCVQN